MRLAKGVFDLSFRPRVVGLGEHAFGTYVRKETTNLVEFYVKCSVETYAKCGPKELYKKALGRRFGAEGLGGRRLIGQVNRRRPKS
jgi:hypothetical protein